MTFSISLIATEPFLLKRYVNLPSGNVLTFRPLQKEDVQELYEFLEFYLRRRVSCVGEVAMISPKLTAYVTQFDFITSSLNITEYS